MAKEYLDKDGLLYLWQKIKTYFTGTAVPNMDGTAATGTSAKFAREDHVHPSDTTKVDKVTGKGLSTEDYTTSEKTKLSGIASGAEVNQNAFSNVKVGSTTLAADAKTDTLELVAGSNVTLTPDATNDKVTIAATDTTYSDATTSAHGLMSASDKTKLNGIATGAEVNVQSDWDQTDTSADDYIKNKPTIPAGVSPATSSPLMDGTAAVGTSDKYAREDHVHPTDTSRAAASHSHVQADLDGAEVWRASSSSTASSATKTATCNNFAVKNGAIIELTSSTANTNTGALTIDVNDTGAYQIKLNGSPVSSSNPLLWDANETLLFAFNGTSSNGAWNFLSKSGKASTANYGMTKLNSSTSSTSTTEAATPSAVKSTYDLANAAIPSSEKGAASGVCPLNASSKIDSTYLPSYVDDVIEAYPRSGQTELSSTWLATGSASGTVITPETGKIYVLMEDSTNYSANTQFRWGGTAYVKLADGGVSSITNAEIDTIMAS